MWISQTEYRKVGAVLKNARLKADVEQKRLAKALGKPQSFVSAYERGQRRIDVLELIKIASALRLDAKTLFGEIVALKTRG